MAESTFFYTNMITFCRVRRMYMNQHDTYRVLQCFDNPILLFRIVFHGLSLPRLLPLLLILSAKHCKSGQTIVVAMRMFHQTTLVVLIGQNDWHCYNLHIFCKQSLERRKFDFSHGAKISCRIVQK